MAARTIPPNPRAAALTGNSALFLLDSDGGITGWTRRAAAVSGYPPEELRGMPFDRLFASGVTGGGTATALRSARRRGRFSAEGWFEFPFLSKPYRASELARKLRDSPTSHSRKSKR